LQCSLAPLGDVVATGRDEIDLAKPDTISAWIRDVKPDVIVNAAAYTAVDKAESEPDLAMAINGVAPGILAEEAKRIGALLVHYSTDYVFDGTKSTPYVEDDVPNPLSVYGETKLAGERAIEEIGPRHVILRTSWVYGARGKNFLLTILKLAKERDELRIVDDQIGAPTWCRTIAEATTRVIQRITNDPSGNDDQGVFHLTAHGQTSWFGFAEVALGMVEKQIGKDCPRLVRISTAQYPTAAARPLNSQLSNERLKNIFGFIAPEWKVSLASCLSEII
jgi:dTDP-4-dehydrorhamnose reductase